MPRWQDAATDRQRLLFRCEREFAIAGVALVSGQVVQGGGEAKSVYGRGPPQAVHAPSRQRRGLSVLAVSAEDFGVVDRERPRPRVVVAAQRAHAIPGVPGQVFRVGVSLPMRQQLGALHPQLRCGGVGRGDRRCIRAQPGIGGVERALRAVQILGQQPHFGLPRMHLQNVVGLGRG